MKWDNGLLFMMGGVVGVMFLWWLVTSCYGSMSYTQIWNELERQHLPTPIFADKSQLEGILQQYGK